MQLGARKRLVVLRCPRLGGLQQAGLDDAVATSLALLPACAAAINLQQLAAPAAGCSTEQRNAEALLPAAGAPAAAAAAALAAPAAAPSSPPRPGAPSVPAHGAAQPQEGAAAEEADSVEEEAGGLSAYLTSWFSPTKAPLARPALPASPAAPAGAGLASAGTSGGAPVAAQQQKQHQDKFQHAWQQQQQQQRPWQQPAAKPSIGGSAPAPAPAVAPAAPLPPSAAAVGCGISVDGISVDGVSVCSAGGVLAQLEARLSSVLPSVGVIHLGLPLHSTAQRGSSSGDGSSDGGLVLGWRQQLHVVAEPSECVAKPRQGRVLAATGCCLHWCPAANRHCCPPARLPAAPPPRPHAPPSPARRRAGLGAAGRGRAGPCDCPPGRRLCCVAAAGAE